MNNKPFKEPLPYLASLAVIMMDSALHNKIIYVIIKTFMGPKQIKISKILKENYSIILKKMFKMNQIIKTKDS